MGHSEWQSSWKEASPYIEELRGVWHELDRTTMLNQEKVIDAFIQERVSLTHMWPSTGYGYGDPGRIALEAVFAKVFGAEAALVRPHWASGTHVLKTALFAMLRPNDEALSLTGEPYDTLRPIIEAQAGSLKDFHIGFRHTALLLDYAKGSITIEEALDRLKRAVSPRTALLHIQRSRGYSSRPSISMRKLTEFLEGTRKVLPGMPILVDNCYCEFVEEEEPPSAGADLTVGSLIKNPGGGLAPSGGYAVGTKFAIDKVAASLYAPGLGDEVGSNPAGYRDLFQGLFIAPKVVGEALKGATFAALYFGRIGMTTDPGPFDKRSDIVQCIETGSPETLLALTRAIQSASPVDSFATPEPWDMPGYEHQVVMAAGTFVQGASIELSCDAPFAPPYAAYLQGGLTSEHVVIACLRAGKAIAQRMDR